MDCIKNLTACLGCTKKHAKCSWKDVSLEELESTATAVKERAEKDGEPAGPSSTEWDNILKRTRTSSTDTASRQTPETNSKNGEIASNKSTTPRMASPAQPGSVQSQPQESPRLNLRPPPLDQQPREQNHEQPRPSAPPAQQTTRFSPFTRPSSSGLITASARPKVEMADDGDRLAVVAAQVYRTASQNAARTSESKTEQTP